VGSGNAGLFHKRRIENECAAVDEGVVGAFEGFPSTAGRRAAGEQIFVNLEIALKVQCIAGVPVAFPRECKQEFLSEGGRVFSGKR